MNTFIPSALLNSTVAHLARFAPFNEMAAGDLTWLAAHLRVNYYAKEDVLLNAAQDAARCFIIKQGGVAGAVGQGVTLQLAAGECFPLGALLAKRPVANAYRASEDTFCYELDAADFDALVKRSAPFQDFCTRRMANLLEQSQRAMQSRFSASSSQQQNMRTPLRQLVRATPITCAPDTPIRTVLRLMRDESVGAVVVVDENKRPIGIFTLHDLLTRVALGEVETRHSIAQVMTHDPMTLPASALAHEAALLMAHHGFRHAVVVDENRVAGVVSENDLFAMQRLGMAEIHWAIQRAESRDALLRCSRDVRQLSGNLMAQGVAPENLTQLISTLNDLLTSRVIELAVASAGMGDIEFCWLALGSEGRCEQTLSADQDNGVIFSVPAGATVDQVRARLLPVVQGINRSLDACGFALCKGDIMAGNPQWCLSLDEWDAAFANWIHRGDAPVLLNASIFFDFRALYGADHLARELRQRLSARLKGNRLFLRHMAANALHNTPPLGLLRDFVVSEADHSIDLKINGITHFVDAARIYALAADVGETNTARRLQQVARTWRWDATQVSAWIDAFFFLQMLRLRLHREQIERGEPLGNRIDPDQLNELDRRILKEAFRQARKLQALLERDFQF